MQPDTGSHDLTDQYARVMERLSKLPPFRPASLKLLAVATDGYSAMDDFAKIFTADPAMAADLLLVANSMEFGSRSRIETIRHALSFLGLERVRFLASTIAVSAAVHQASRESVRPSWLHSIATAVIAEKLGVIHDMPGVYTAALVHDLGRLGLLSAGRDRYDAVLLTAFEDIEESNRLERALFGMDHCKAGAFLSEKWGFPISLQVAMSAHHETVAMSPQRKLVRIACRLADSLGFPEVTLRDPDLSEAQCRQAGLSPDAVRDEIALRMATLGEEVPAAEIAGRAGEPRSVRSGMIPVPV
jgi:HD-like signal output (HDOD) protein